MSANVSLNERIEPLRVAVYARVSTDKQDNGNQLIQLREFCHRQGWEIVNEFCEHRFRQRQEGSGQFRTHDAGCKSKTIRCTGLLVAGSAFP
jgi:predicted site-specific integrase-resolvase